MTSRLPLLVCLSAVALVVAVPLAHSDEASLWPKVLEALPPQAPPAPLPSLSAQTCNGCHAEIHDQWASSGHAHASTNPVYVAARGALGDPPLCDECHLPLENQRATLPKGPGALGRTDRQPNPNWSATLATEGVTCAACHVRDGVIHGPRDLAPERAPHPVKRDESIKTAEACAFCHQAALPGGEEHPFLDTVGEWRRSPFAENGVSCQDCHMTRTSGAIAGSRYAAFASHGMLGGRDPAKIARALTVDVSIRSPKVQRGDDVRATVTVMNTGAGHAVPSGDPSHQVEIRFSVVGPDGELAKDGDPQSQWLSRTVGAEPPFVEEADDRLEPAASRTFDFSWSVGKKLTPGTYTLVVSTHWWAVGPERATGLDLEEETVRVDVASQRVPVRID
ncbi:MAG: hypothetical protein KDA24_20065 [Deltaproteobacteria bacterium]|nr:hypothetical protein [Deltaproteobacteria bacterium]